MIPSKVPAARTDLKQCWENPAISLIGSEEGRTGAHGSQSELTGNPMHNPCAQGAVYSKNTTVGHNVGTCPAPTS